MKQGTHHTIETKKKIGNKVSLALAKPEVYKRMSEIRTDKNRPVGVVDNKLCLFCKNEFKRPHQGAWKTWIMRKYCSVQCRTEDVLLNGLQKGKNNPRYGKKITEETRVKMKSYKGEQRYNYKGGYENRLFQVKLYRVRKIGAVGSHTKAEWDLLKISQKPQVLTEIETEKIGCSFWVVVFEQFPRPGDCRR